MTERLKMKISEYRQRCFAPGSAPDRRTVIARIMSGELAGGQEGKLWYVYSAEKPTPEQVIASLIEEFDREVVT